MANDALETEWQKIAKGMLRIEMVRREISYADLVGLLAAWGIEDNERNLRNKVARGTFSATFFLQCLVAMGIDGLTLDQKYFPKPGREFILSPTRAGWPE